MTNNAQRGKDALKELDRELKARDRKEKSKPWSVAALALLVLALVGGGIYFAATWNSDEDVTAEESNEQSTEPSEDLTPVALAKKRSTPLEDTVTCTYTEDGRGEYYKGLPKQDNVSTQGTVDVEFDTSAGPIGLTLDRSVSPCTVNAIEYLVKEKYYDDTVCHRLTSGGINVLQCGDPSGTGAGGPGFQFPDEYPVDDDAENTNQSVIYERGTVAMANSGPDTNGSQFFLNYGESPLAPAYTYFGTINEEGLATLDKIAEAGIAEDSQSAMGSGDGAPKEEVKIKKATIS